MSDFAPLIAPLFVPATRPERIEKAAMSGADAVIVDLEDAVPVPQKEDARAAFAEWLKARGTPLSVPIFVRLNAVGSPWFDADLAFVRGAGGLGVMLPKTERAEDIVRIGEDIPVIGLVETARGIASLAEICTAPGLNQLAFGSIDYALDLGCSETREALLLARLSLVTQSRAHGLPAPIDGVTVSAKDEALIHDDTTYAKGLGFGGKLAIHPLQIPVIMAALAPSEAEVSWATAVCKLAEENQGKTVMFEGNMIDTPVIAKAQQLLARAGGKPAIA